jgi:hypothetical protein
MGGQVLRAQGSVILWAREEVMYRYDLDGTGRLESLDLDLWPYHLAFYGDDVFFNTESSLWRLDFERGQPALLSGELGTSPLEMDEGWLYALSRFGDAILHARR